MLHDIVASLLRPGGPFLYVRLVTAAYAVSAVGRLLPVRRKQVPGYRRRMAGPAVGQSRARHRSRPGQMSSSWRARQTASPR